MDHLEDFLLHLDDEDGLREDGVQLERILRSNTELLPILERSASTLTRSSILIKPASGSPKWTFSEVRNRLLNQGIEKYGITMEKSLGFQLSLLINELGKLLLRSPVVNREYVQLKKHHLMMSQEGLLTLLITSYQRIASSRTIAYLAYINEVIGRLLSVGDFGDVLRDIMTWEPSVYNPRYSFVDHFKDDLFDELIDILPNELSQREDFLVQWFCNVRSLLRSNRTIMTDTSRTHTLKNIQCEYAVFLLACVKLSNTNVNRAMKNGSCEINKDLTKFLQMDQVFKQESTGKVLTPHAHPKSHNTNSYTSMQSNELMKQRHCYAIFHRQLRLAYAQELEFLHIFHHKKFLYRSSTIYFVENHEKKLFDYHQSFAECQFIDQHPNDSINGRTLSPSKSKAGLLRPSTASAPGDRSDSRRELSPKKASTRPSTASSDKAFFEPPSPTAPIHVMPLADKMYHYLRSTNEYKNIVGNPHNNNVIFNLLYSLLCADVMKHPSNAVLHIMVLDLIAKKKLQWSSVCPSTTRSGSQKFHTGIDDEEELSNEEISSTLLLPMASKKLMNQTRHIAQFFNEFSDMKYLYDKPLPSALQNSDNAEVKTKIEISQFEELVDKENTIIRMWLEHEGVDVDKTAGIVNAEIIHKITDLIFHWFNIDLGDLMT